MSTGALLAIYSFYKAIVTQSHSPVGMIVYIRQRAMNGSLANQMISGNEDPYEKQSERPFQLSQPLALPVRMAPRLSGSMSQCIDVRFHELM